MWYEHADSPANIADGGSHEGVTDASARRMKITLESFSLPKADGQFLTLIEIQQQIIGEWVSSLGEFEILVAPLDLPFDRLPEMQTL